MLVYNLIDSDQGHPTNEDLPGQNLQLLELKHSAYAGSEPRTTILLKVLRKITRMQCIVQRNQH